MSFKLRKEINTLCIKYPTKTRHFMLTYIGDKRINFERTSNHPRKTPPEVLQAFRLCVVKARLMGIEVIGWPEKP